MHTLNPPPAQLHYNLEILCFLGPSASDLAGDHHQQRAHSHGTTLGMFFPCACVPPQCLPISGVRLWSVFAINVQWRDHSDVHGQLPPNNVKPSAMTSTRRASLLWENVMSRSRSITFVDTLAPPSLQICAMAFSASDSLLPSNPTVLHAPLWWPKASSGRQHRQVQTVKGKGKRRRRS